jgi:hypothetical protein
MDRGLKNILIWFFQILAACIFFMTSWAKFSGQPTDIKIFTELGMEPTGRYIIAVVEGSAAIFLLTRRLSATGAVLGLGTMMGALIAHLSILGFDASHAALWGTVTLSTLIVMVGRRRYIPLLGSGFEA